MASHHAANDTAIDVAANALRLSRARQLEQRATRLEDEALSRYLETGTEEHLSEYEMAGSYKWRVAQVRVRLEAREAMHAQLPSQGEA